MKKIKISIVMVCLLFLLCLSTLFACTPKDSDFRLIVPKKWELEVGDSRTVDYSFSPEITNRLLTWSATPEKIATVDKWGRVTALKVGIARIKATTSEGLHHTVRVKIVKESKTKKVSQTKIDYTGSAVSLNSVLQKIVTRYPIDSLDIPEHIRNLSDFSQYQSVMTPDGAVWTIKDYGVLREDENALNSRDAKQRFMGDRYFYTKDLAPLAIVDDGNNGIWAIMQAGVTHIELRAMSGIEKAITMSEFTNENVSRHGYVSEARLVNGKWVGQESDNDGLWTSMYAAGELMKYAALKDRGQATTEQIARARESAMLATEAVLLLSNLCMRTGSVEAYIRYQPNAYFDPANGRYFSELALKKDGDYSLNLPNASPAEVFERAYESYINDGEPIFYFNEEHMNPFVDSDWGDPREGDEAEFEKRTKNLEGYIVRTYSFREENNGVGGYIHWSFNEDGTASGVSTMDPSRVGYYINGENLREVVVDASGNVPERLWKSLISQGYSVADIIYKGDTSSDELIGHLFLYKLAYDILGQEDKEIKDIISNTVNRLAQHITDNGYMMVDGSGQPGTWSKFNRAFFYNSSQLGGAPLTSSVLLSLFKLAHYVTGYQKWHNEYLMAALDQSYEYAKIMTQYQKQCHLVMLMTLDDAVGTDVRKILEKSIDLSLGSKESEMLTRVFLNYSDEEMAMLAFYLLFQMEKDEVLLGYYREAIDQWWISMKYSENPLWYYIYQLAYPNSQILDAYGNDILETASWALSRHPIDTRKYSASSVLRDDIAQLDLTSLGVDLDYTLSYDLDGPTITTGSGIAAITQFLNRGSSLKWAVAAPDERPFHKYNNHFFDLNGNYNPNQLEGSTTYTLPFWMGIYHGMLSE